MTLQLPTPSATAQAASLALSQLIQNEIQQNQAWIPFSRFMELALYAPQYGYYTGGAHKIGAAGDFITAPTLSPLFGQALAQQLNALLPQTAGNLYEFGAGTGALAATLLQHLTPNTLQHYYIIELSPELAERQRQHITHTVPHLAHHIIHLHELPQQFDGIIIGNEVLDAMPVEIICQGHQQLLQMGVTHHHNQFHWQAQPLTQPHLIQAAQTYFPPITPYTSELHPAQYAFIHTLAQKLTRGGMIFIDYGFDASQYYHPQRNQGTLIGHYRHHTIHDPFFHIGLTDLTAHVNFTDIAQAGTDGELDLIGYTTQSHFLLNLGITHLLAQTGEPHSPAYIQASTVLHQLIGQHEMGELFKVIAFGRNIDIDWQGFTHGDLCHKL